MKNVNCAYKMNRRSVVQFNKNRLPSLPASVCIVSMVEEMSVRSKKFFNLGHTIFWTANHELP